MSWELLLIYWAQCWLSATTQGVGVGGETPAALKWSGLETAGWKECHREVVSDSMAVWKSIHQKFPFDEINQVWRLNPNTPRLLLYFLLYFLLLRLRFCNSCPPPLLFFSDSLLFLFVLFPEKIPHFYPPSVHNSSCTLEDCQSKQLEQTCFVNRVQRAGSLEHLTLGCSDTGCPSFLCQDTLHTQRVQWYQSAVLLIIALRHAQHPTQCQNTGWTPWIYSHFFHLKIFFFFLKRTLCLFVDQAEQFDLTHQKRKGVLFAKSGKTDQTGKTWLNLLIIRESTFMSCGFTVLHFQAWSLSQVGCLERVKQHVSHMFILDRHDGSFRWTGTWEKV